MEEHVVVVDEVGAAVLVEEVHVRVQLVGAPHRGEEVVHHVDLVLGERVGVRPVDGGEVARHELVLVAVHDADPALGVDVLQKQAVLHVPVGVALNRLALELEQDHRDGLLERAHGLARPVGCLGEQGELAQGDAVGALEDLEGVVADVVADHRGEARGRAGGGAHPDDVVVAPLQVNGVILHEAIEDLVGVVAAVEDVADEVEVVDREALDQGGEAHDEVVAGAGVHDRVNDAAVVALALVALAGGGVEQLVDDVGVLGWHGLAHLGARVGVGEVARQAHEAHQRDGVPLLGHDAGGLEATQLAVRVVDERAEVGLLAVGELEAEDVRDALADDAGAVVEDVLERVILAMDVGDEVLSALREVEDGLEVDDLRVGGADGRELLGEQLEVLAVWHAASLLCA